MAIVANPQFIFCRRLDRRPGLEPLHTEKLAFDTSDVFVDSVRNF
jgi:hypothetical protein